MIWEYSEFIVKYYRGNEKHNLYQLWVLAHNRDEARNNCRIQANYRHGGRKKIHITFALSLAEAIEFERYNHVRT